MGLLRLILLIVLGALLHRLWKRWRAQQAARRPPASRDQGHMLACAHCGMYVPEQDAVRDGTQVFCSVAHRNEYLNKHRAAQRKT
ncbi:MAG: hypothetical protein HZB57_02760 [Gammaproteobacteria bacterium]|nr:hypothetical protein [Gammaproteobacteria bacterium]